MNLFFFRRTLDRLVSSPVEILKLALWQLVIFLFALHPVSGWPGGLIYLLVGWALPSIFLATLCVGVALLFSKSKIAQFIIFLCALIFLGINTDLPIIIELLNYLDSCTKCNAV
jgi:hypothetical protein